MRACEHQNRCPGIVANPAVFVVEQGKEQGDCRAIATLLNHVDRLGSHDCIFREQSGPAASTIADLRPGCLTTGKGHEESGSNKKVGAPLLQGGVPEEGQGVGCV